MWSYVVLLSLLVSFAFGEIEIVEGKVGSRVRLDLGEGVTTWMRMKNDGTEETVRYCGPGKTGPGCDQFIVVETKETAFPDSKVLVFPNGTLIFERLTESDGVATYYSPETKPQIFKNEDGSVWGLPPKQIFLALV
ncbi:hypothetical protein Aduo_006502 [Ancylostoma duodenale]